MGDNDDLLDDLLLSLTELDDELNNSEYDKLKEQKYNGNYDTESRGKSLFSENNASINQNILTPETNRQSVDNNSFDKLKADDAKSSADLYDFDSGKDLKNELLILVFLIKSSINIFASKLILIFIFLLNLLISFLSMST